ncbi:MAG TPA: glucose-6-phosphate dehydrogenase, partial [Acidobacteriota bacterium]|nr:glucose-6-phosphate dehydrogenase [Acidobacteriota bacterium]
MRTTVEREERENPLKTGLRLDRSAPPCTVVIFGASGDLTRRKLIPALFNLFEQDLLASGFSVLGSSRSRMDHQKFRQEMRASMEEYGNGGIDDNVWRSFAEGLFYEPSDPSDPASYDRLLKRLQEIDQERGTSENRLFYLSTPPSVYADIISRIGEKKLGHSQTGWTRIVVEKPFGRDYASARELNQLLQNVFSEEQIYRIDHYLGKETVQ